MKNPLRSFADFFFNLGTRSGMPKYAAVLGLVQAAILFIPESIWATIGVNAYRIQAVSPAFVQYYISNSSFKNAMSAFWMFSPFTLIICTVLHTLHINKGTGYQAYLARRAARLKKLGKRNDYSLFVGLLACVIVYVWGTAIYLVEPGIFGSFVPTKNRLAMLIVHAGALGLVVPVVFALLVTEIRASLTAKTTFKE